MVQKQCKIHLEMALPEKKGILRVRAPFRGCNLRPSGQAVALLSATALSGLRTPRNLDGIGTDPTQPSGSVSSAHGTKDIFSQGACAKRHPTINTLCYDTVLAGEPRRRSEVGAALSQQGHDRTMPGRQGRNMTSVGTNNMK